MILIVLGIVVVVLVEDILFNFFLNNVFIMVDLFKFVVFENEKKKKKR